MAAATTARKDATIPLGDTTFPAHAVFNLSVSGDTAEGLLARFAASGVAMVDCFEELLADRIGARLAGWL